MTSEEHAPPGSEGPPVNYDAPAAPDAKAPPEPAAFSIAAVERDTGIAKETLRVWERRYGFPAPTRDALGERLYPLAQVSRLRLLKRLLDAGHRPGRVVGASDDVLATLLVNSAASTATNPTSPAQSHSEELDLCLQLLRRHDVDGLRRALAQALVRRGLSDGVTQLFAPLTVAIGEAWMRGELQVFEEHIYSESLQVVLRQAIQALPPGQPAAQNPRVLLTTLPGEPHVLGLLMAEALLALEGCACLSLGAQTPVAEVPAAAAAHRADVVALSFTSYLSQRDVHQGLAHLREQLPSPVEVWAGGSNRALKHAACPAGVLALPTLDAIAAQVARWRTGAPSPGALHS